MEYYYYEPIGILASFQSNDKETLLLLLNKALKEQPDNILGFLQNHHINRAFTLIAPRFKYMFELKDAKITEIADK